MNIPDLCLFLVDRNILSLDIANQKLIQLENLKSMKLKYIEKARKKLM